MRAQGRMGIFQSMSATRGLAPPCTLIHARSHGCWDAKEGSGRLSPDSMTPSEWLKPQERTGRAPSQRLLVFERRSLRLLSGNVQIFSFSSQRLFPRGSRLPVSDSFVCSCFPLFPESTFRIYQGVPSYSWTFFSCTLFLFISFYFISFHLARWGGGAGEEGEGVSTEYYPEKRSGSLSNSE